MSAILTPAVDLCPNCSTPIDDHPENGCGLRMLVGVLQDRGYKTNEEIRKLFKDCDPDLLWVDLGPIADKFENGDYSMEGA